MPVVEHWQDEPEEHDFPAAADYLSLVASPSEVAKVVEALRSAETAHRKAKDLLRASRLGLLSADNIHVKKDLEKVAAGQRLYLTAKERIDVMASDGPVVLDGDGVTSHRRQRAGTIAGLSQRAVRRGSA